MAVTGPARTFTSLAPDSQLLFAAKLDAVRTLFLHEALAEAVGRVDLKKVDAELHLIAAAPSLTSLAAFGLRGESFFPVPSLLSVKPSLLGYYRLLYGISQKRFYKGTAYGAFKNMETKGTIRTDQVADLEHLCMAIGKTGDVLVAALTPMSVELIHELQLLTYGAQLKGMENNLIGNAGIKEFKDFLLTVIPTEVISSLSDSVIVFRNAAGRTVTITIAADPDISIVEAGLLGFNQLLAIEIKAGTDASNRLNRLGEAEKSHLKARSRGHTRFWTIVKVPYSQADMSANSPTTQEFWLMDRIKDPHDSDHARFVEAFKSNVGLR